jgi:hypothetical protein
VDDVRGGGEAAIDELMAQVDEPVRVGGGDGDFHYVVVGHVGVSTSRRRRVIAAWA